MPIRSRFDLRCWSSIARDLRIRLVMCIFGCRAPSKSAYAAGDYIVTDGLRRGRRIPRSGPQIVAIGDPGVDIFQRPSNT